MDALDLLVRTALRFGDRVVVEDPCFPPLVDLLESVGAQLVGVPLDDEGLALEPLAAALERARGRGLPPAARPEPDRGDDDGPPSARHRPAARRQCDSRGRGRLGRRPVPRPAREPGPLAPRAHGIRAVVLQVPRPRPAPRRTVGTARADAVRHGAPPAGTGVVEPAAAAGAAHACSPIAGTRASIDAAREAYAARRAALVAALEARGVEVGGTEGLNIWVPVHDETAAVVRLASQGIGVAHGAPFRVGHAAGGGGHIRLTVGLARDGLRRAGRRGGRGRTDDQPQRPGPLSGADGALRRLDGALRRTGRHEGRAAGLPGLRPAARKQTSLCPEVRRPMPRASSLTSVVQFAQDC